jgi:DNA-binding LytR/AlgR family response regulator
MKCLIVDDNKMARMATAELLNQTKMVKVTGECSSGLEAYTFIKSNPVDLVILDIEMPGMSGIDLLKSLPDAPIVIFSTAKKNYAVDAFELNVADYIIKPVSLPRLLQAIEKARSIFKHRHDVVSKIAHDFIFLKDKGTLRKIKLSDILWIEALGDYVKIHVTDKWFMLHTTLKQLEGKLPSANFLKVHRSYIIALDKIDYIEEGVIYVNRAPVPLTETYRNLLMERLNLIN